MKHLKKNDGYVVVYVLIVFTILSLVAVSICSVALKNLKAQRASVDRMGVRYEAEAYLQEFIANVERLTSGETKYSEDEIRGAIETAVPDEIIHTGVNGTAELISSTFSCLDDIRGQFETDAEDGDTKIILLPLNVLAKYTDDGGRTAKIDAVLNVPVLVEIDIITTLDDPSTPENEADINEQYMYEVSGPIQYKDYTISYEGGGA